MAKVRLTEDEFRGLIRRIISETKNNIIDEAYKSYGAKSMEVQVDLETDEDIEFSIAGDISFYDDEDFDVQSYWLIDGTYDPQFKIDIENYINNNGYKIETALIDEARGIMQTTADYGNEYGE